MDFNWINIWGAAVILLIMAPNILYSLRHKDFHLESGSRIIGALEQAGRFGCIALMVLPLGVRGGEFGFASVGEMIGLAGVTFILLAAYYVRWLSFSQAPAKKYAMTLAILPCILFFAHAWFLRHWLLGIFAAVFAVSHIHITYHSAI